MLMPAYHLNVAARNLTIIFISALVSFFVFYGVHVSRFPVAQTQGIPRFSTSSVPLRQGIPASKRDYSPAAIRCRIQAAQAQARIAFRAQSTTPDEAIAEYKRRYHRGPPTGFSDWVQFALDHDSKVIDDFDQIERDLEPYRAPEAQRVFHVLNEQREDWSYTRRVRFDKGSMFSSGDYMYHDQWRQLIEPFLHALPNNSLFYMSTIDEPRVLSKSGPPPDHISFLDRAGQSVEDLVTESCAQLPRELTSRPYQEKDVCQFSKPGHLHGMIASPNTFSYTHSLVPMLSFGRMSAFRDILIPCPCYLDHPILESDPVSFWDKEPALYWRGSSTGGRASKQDWRHGHRARFVAFVQSLQNAAKVLDASRYFGAKVESLDERHIILFKDAFNVHMPAYIQCEHGGDKSACTDMERVLGPGSFEPEDASLGYRYLFDLDGNSMSTRFYRLLSRRAVVLKQTWFQEWHDDRLIPWAHYIPVTMGMEELPSLMNFLINDPDGEGFSTEIAEAGHNWSQQALRKIDLSIYVYRLLLELAAIYGPVDSIGPVTKS